MKKYLILLVLFILLPHARSDAQIKLGVIGGTIQSDLSGTQPKDTKYMKKSGFGAGVILGKNLTADVELNIQPMFLQKGSDFRIGNPSKDDTITVAKINLDYFNVPVVFNILLGKSRFYLSSGVDFAFLLNAEFDDSGDKTDLKDTVRPVDIAADFGVGYRFPVHKAFIFIEARYSQGLMNISDSEDNPSQSIATNIKSFGFQLFTGIVFSF
jgi:hypothetical protein